jgi:hypothetical protein
LTSTEGQARRDRWLRAVWSGFLAEFSTVLTIILIAQAYVHLFAPNPSDPSNAAIFERIGGIVGTIAGTLYTYLFARLLMLLLTRRFVEHGVVVALTAIAFSVGGSIAGHHGVPLLYVPASILKLAAGALAGFLAAKQYAPVGDG